MSLPYWRKIEGGRGGGDLTAIAGLTPSLGAATPTRAGEQFKRLYGSDEGGCASTSPSAQRPPERFKLSNQKSNHPERESTLKKLSYVICPRSRNTMHRTQGLLATPSPKMCLGEGHNQIKAHLPYCARERRHT